MRDLSVLVVDDNATSREILEGAGLEVTIANNGKEAVDTVKEIKFDAVLMDIQMPVMDGYTATKAIRKWEGGRQKTENRRQKTEDR